MILALWGQPCARLLSHCGEKYCPNGGIAFRPHYGGGYRDRRRAACDPGSTNAIMAPIPDPQETAELQGRTAKGSTILAVWGQPSTRVPSFGFGGHNAVLIVCKFVDELEPQSA
jgi:hypothetical protein